MDDHRYFDMLRVNELSVTRKGLFSPVYEITDGQFSYGKIISNKVAGKPAVLETAEETWTIEREGKIFIKALSIINAKGETIGKIKVGEYLLQFNDDFEMRYGGVKGSFTQIRCWYNPQNEVLMSAKLSSSSYSTPYKFWFENDAARQMKHTPMLTLLLIYLSFLDQIRKF